MGNTIRKRHPQFRLVRQCDDKRFGLISIWQQGSQLVIQKSITFNSVGEQEDYMKQCLQAKQLSQESLLQIYDCECDEDQVHIYFEYYESDLAKEVIQRGMEQVPFTNEEMMFLIEKLIAVGQYLQMSGIYHGDLRSSNILLDDQGVPKIADYGLIHPLKSGPIKTLHIWNKTYLSPELLESIRMKQSSPNMDYFKNDIFTLGMTFLELATLTNLHCCYNLNQRSMNVGILNEFLNQMNETYSPRVSGIIREMLQLNPQQRPDYNSLSQLIRNGTYTKPQPVIAPLRPQPTVFQEHPRMSTRVSRPQLTNHANFSIMKPQQLRQPSPINSARPMQRSFSVNQRQPSVHYLPPQMVCSPGVISQSPLRTPMRLSTMPMQDPLTFNPRGSIYITFADLQKKESFFPPAQFMQSYQVPRSDSQPRNQDIHIKDTRVSDFTHKNVSQEPSVVNQKSNGIDDLDERVNRAIQQTQETILRSTNTIGQARAN